MYECAHLDLDETFPLQYLMWFEHFFKGYNMYECAHLDLDEAFLLGLSNALLLNPLSFVHSF